MSVYKISNRRWFIVATLFLAIICNYLDRQLLSILKPEILGHFAIGNVEYALVVNVFLVCYAIMYPVSGILVDKLGPKKVILGGIAVWSLACIGAGSCGPNQFFLFTCCRGLLGLAEPTIFAGQLLAVSLWFQKKERAFPNALCQAGSALGAIIAPILIAALMGWLDSWQNVFLLAGVVGLLLAVVWLFLYKTPEEKVLALTVENAADDSTEKSFKIKELFKTKSCWGGILIRLVSDPVWYFCCFWLPGFLRTMGEVEGLPTEATLDMIQWLGSLPFLVGGIVGMTVGLVSDRLIRRGVEPIKARKRILYVVTCLAPVVALVPFVSNSSMAFDLRVNLVVLIFCVISAVCNAWLYNAPLTIVEQFPMKNRAAVFGFCCGAGALGSVVFNSFVGSIPESGWTVLFICMAFLHIIAAIILAKMVHPERVPDENN